MKIQAIKSLRVELDSINKMDKIPVDPTNSNAPYGVPAPQAGSIFGFIGEALRNRLYDTFLKPPTFVHSPPNPPSPGDQSRNRGAGVGNNGRQDRGDLNFPFSVISPSTVATDTESTSNSVTDELGVLDEKISELEDSMKHILNTPQEIDKQRSPPSEVTVYTETVGPIPFEEMGTLLLPPLSRMKEKMPPGIYQELLAIYESQLLMTGGGVPDLNLNKDGKVDVAVSVSNSTIPSVSDEVEKCKNKEKNLRSEVLKWNKD